MIKHIKIGLFLLLFTVPLMLYGIHLNNGRIHALSRGNYFFDITRNHPQISSINLKFADGKTISINRKEDLWFVKEADDYFVSFKKINTLVTLIRNTIIYRADALEKNALPFLEKDSLVIESVDNTGKVIEKAVIAPKKEKNKHHYAMLNNDNFLYQISGNFDISSNVLDWLQMPILKINKKEIREIKSDKFYVSRRFDGENFLEKDTNKHTPHIDSFINQLWYLSAMDVKHSVNFKFDNYKKTSTFDILLFNGIIYHLTFYSNENEYWLNVRLDRDKLMSEVGINILEENSMLFKGWYFKLPSDKGDIISNFSI